MTHDRRIDLHMHSQHSDDGELAPETLVRMARDAGLACVALPDHNDASGNDSFLAAARDAGLAAVPGVELDCGLDGTGLHVLGYFIDHADPRYAALRADVLGQKIADSGRRMDGARALGIVFDEVRIRELSPDGVVTAETIAEAAMENPANDGNPVLLPYRAGGVRSDNPLLNFYWDYYAPGKVCHTHIRYMTLAEAVELITGTGGVPVLAHPGQSLRGRENLIDAIADHGVRGVEAYSSYHTAEQRGHWLREAERLGLFPVCGSDFHGKVKPAITLGRHGAEGKEAGILKALFASCGKIADCGH
jgi:predicted metal-dependent phosphoesterase TrpH